MQELRMALGVGRCTAQEALDGLSPMLGELPDIQPAEYLARQARVQALMRAQGVSALVLHAGANLRYFSGLVWSASERFVGAVLPAEGALRYVAPWFELGTVNDLLQIAGPVHSWHEHENAYACVHAALAAAGVEQGRVALDENLPYFMVDGLQRSAPAQMQLFSAAELTAACRMHKSEHELALMQRAFDMTLAVQRATASMLREGISTQEVAEFIDAAHRRVGAKGSSFVIVLFGEASSYPHGVKHVQHLRPGDVVLIDTGCYVHGYTSDLTRSYVYGTPSARVREIWSLEKRAQAAAFQAARLGAPCSAVDAAARACLESAGLGPSYSLPGLPHRTGHGIGLSIHERPYLVASDHTPLAPGMCFSNEPMIVLPGEFGIRLEDHFYMTEHGPRWFTPPSRSLDDPFGLAPPDLG